MFITKNRFKLIAHIDDAGRDDSYKLIGYAENADNAFSEAINYNKINGLAVTIINISHPSCIEYPKFFIVDGRKYRLPDPVNAEYCKMMNDGE